MKDWIILGNNRLETLVAISDQDHENGLMYRDWPPPVMSFPYNKAEQRKFWMKNTPSPLDLIFCNNNKIIAIYAGTPFSEELIGPNVSCNLVVELPQGLSNKLNLQINQRAQLHYSIMTVARRYRNELEKRGNNF